jgi:prepilin-type N-terminal cleavage/methylation domain-containing protein
VPLPTRVPPARGAGPSTQAGFTLLETLVALTIVAIGFAGAFGAMPESLGAQDRARNLEAATGVAEAALAQGTPGEGTDGRFAWHAEALPIPGAPQPQPGAFAGQVLRVTVRWPEGRTTRTITLQTVRLGLLPPG